MLTCLHEKRNECQEVKINFHIIAIGYDFSLFIIILTHKIVASKKFSMSSKVENLRNFLI